MLVDRFGRKAVIVPATLISGLSMVLFVLASSPFWFTVSCVVWGIAASVGGTAPAAYAADSVPVPSIYFIRTGNGFFAAAGGTPFAE